MNGLNTLKEFAQKFKNVPIGSDEHLQLYVKTERSLKRLKSTELVALASKIGLTTTTINGKTLGYTKDQWIDLLLQYSHLSLNDNAMS
jgi:hypothetical protein